MKLQANIFKRDFTVIKYNPLDPKVISYSHKAVGGPSAAELEVTGNKYKLMSVLNQLRAPVTITDDKSRVVWWGYISEVHVMSGSLDIGVSIDTMVNNIAVVYSSVVTGSQEVGTRTTTAYAGNQISIDEYGYKELLESISGATSAQAEMMRDILLDQKKYPVPTIKIIPGESEEKAIIYCRGWWDTLLWKYYSNTGTSSTVTTTQISDIVTSDGQFLTATDIDTASGISSSEYRDGDSTAQAEILDLLRAGTSNDLRLVARVTDERRLYVYQEALYTAFKYILKKDGSLITKPGTKVEKHLCPVADWVRVQDVIDFDGSFLADPSYFFIEESEYKAKTDTLKLLSRGVPNPFDVLRGLQL